MTEQEEKLYLQSVYRAAKHLENNPDFLLLMNHFSGIAVKAISDLGEHAGSVNTQSLVAAAAMLNTVQNIVPKTRKFIALYEEGQRKDEKGSAKIEQSPDTSGI